MPQLFLQRHSNRQGRYRLPTNHSGHGHFQTSPRQVPLLSPSDLWSLHDGYQQPHAVTVLNESRFATNPLLLGHQQCIALRRQAQDSRDAGSTGTRCLVSPCGCGPSIGTSRRPGPSGNGPGSFGHGRSRRNLWWEQVQIKRQRELFSKSLSSMWRRKEVGLQGHALAEEVEAGSLETGGEGATWNRVKTCAIYETMGFWTRSICIGMCLLFLLSFAVLVLHIAIYSVQSKGKREVIKVFETVIPTRWTWSSFREDSLLICIQRRVIDH